MGTSKCACCSSPPTHTPLSLSPARPPTPARPTPAAPARLQVFSNQPDQDSSFITTGPYAVASVSLGRGGGECEVPLTLLCEPARRSKGCRGASSVAARRPYDCGWRGQHCGHRLFGTVLRSLVKSDFGEHDKCRPALICTEPQQNAKPGTNGDSEWRDFRMADPQIRMLPNIMNLRSGILAMSTADGSSSLVSTRMCSF